MVHGSGFKPGPFWQRVSALTGARFSIPGTIAYEASARYLIRSSWARITVRALDLKVLGLGFEPQFEDLPFE
ncbi:hypothetical protein DPMN_193727 [Dreissena polymorpha]|uniref:Uncharacterized protein n=1 Tax=Dreissena polymorpha TaxID=45954 RepID=A0A9D3Y181_DREPO|nr:hypothetical protein DPMN_193727 [Dreissena polymorpha]